MSILVQNRNFRLLFSASAISNLGDGISALAFPWLATLITRDPALIALVAFATRLPWLLFSIPAGVITDRHDRKSLMVRADLFRLILTGGVIALILQVDPVPPDSGAVTYILALCALAFLLGTAEVIRDNAAQTVLPTVVEKSQLEQANDQLWSIEQVMGSFVGPPLAGLLIAAAVPAPFAVDALTFALAAWIVWCIAIPPRAAPIRKPVMAEAAEGVRWMRAHPIVLQLAVMLGLMNALHMATLTILILFSQEILGLSAAGHGILLTAGAAGGVIGGMLCPRIAAHLGGRRSLLLALTLFVPPLIAIALTHSVLVTAAALFTEMFAALLWNVVTVSYRQRLIPDGLLGRVNSIYRFFGWGMMPFGALLGGWAVTWLEPEITRNLALRAVFVFAAAGFTLMLLYAALRLKLDRS